MSNILQLRLFFLLVFHIKFEREGENKNHNVLQTSISWMSTVFSVHLAHHHVTAALCIQHDVKIGVWTSSAHLLWGFVCFVLFFTASFSLSIQSSWLNYLPLSVIYPSQYFSALRFVSMMPPLSLLESCIHQSREEPSTQIKMGSQIVTRQFLSLCHCHYMNVIIQV